MGNLHNLVSAVLLWATFLGHIVMRRHRRIIYSLTTICATTAAGVAVITSGLSNGLHTFWAQSADALCRMPTIPGYGFARFVS